MVVNLPLQHEDHDLNSCRVGKYSEFPSGLVTLWASVGRMMLCEPAGWMSFHYETLPTAAFVSDLRAGVAPDFGAFS